MGTLYMCFYGDSRLWDNVILTAAYPSGFTYFRPFRYRDKWIHRGLLREMEDPAQREKLCGEGAVLAMRWLSEQHRWLLLPIRKVRITRVSFLRNDHSVYFALSDMVDFGAVRNLRQACVEIPPGEREDSAECLFFRSSATAPGDRFATVDQDASWVAYSDLVAKDPGLPVANEARHSMFWRFSPPSNHQTAATAEIHHSGQTGDVLGAELSEGMSYELTLHHRVPVLHGTHTTMGQVAVGYEVSTGNIELGRASEDYTGNYQKHILPIAARQPSGTYEELVVRPAAATATAGDGQIINLLSLRIRMKVKRSIWYRIRQQWAPLFVLWVVLVLMHFVDSIVNKHMVAPLAITYALLAAMAVILVAKVLR